MLLQISSVGKVNMNQTQTKVLSRRQAGKATLNTIIAIGVATLISKVDGLGISKVKAVTG